jgi:hypothetical protein
MLEELNIMKLNFEVKHRFDFSGTLKMSYPLSHTVVNKQKRKKEQ